MISAVSANLYVSLVSSPAGIPSPLLFTLFNRSGAIVWPVTLHEMCPVAA
jgi:hypothetical protein